jgi:23S rRNA pseudouridine1911/1915/1917 synthase
MPPPSPLVDAVIPADIAGERLDRAIARLCPTLSRLEARRMIAGGSVFVDQRRTRIASKLLRAGQRLCCYRLAAAPPGGAAPRVVFRGDGFLVVDKPAGVAVEATRAGDVATVARWLAGQGETAFVTHRLDAAVSGALVVATTAAAQAALNRLFAAHGVERRYLAAVSPAPSWEEKTIERPLDDQPARTRARVAARAAEAALVEVRLDTGRFRQIRRHLAAEGVPVVGDRDQKNAARAERTLLHAHRVVFTMAGQAVDVSVPLGDDFRTALKALGLDS